MDIVSRTDSICKQLEKCLSETHVHHNLFKICSVFIIVGRPSYHFHNLQVKEPAYTVIQAGLLKDDSSVFKILSVRTLCILRF
jgi:hypothetical protein